MSVFVSIEDQDGELLSKCFEVKRVFRHFKAIENSVCLIYVSEDEDSMFNQLQISNLIKELEVLEAKEIKADEKEELDQVIKAVKKIQGKKNTYVRFYGEH